MCKRNLLIILIFISLILLPACSIQSNPGPTATSEANYYPAANWRTSTSEEQGLDSDLLEEMLEITNKRSWDVDHISIIRHGYMVFDVSRGSYEAENPHQIYSCTKSVVSILVGIAVDQGLIPGVDTPLTELFPDREIDNLDSRKQSINLDHLLSMTAGFECRDSYLYQWRGLNEMMASDDWTQHVLDLPMEHDPGTHFEYCNGVSNLLSASIQQAAGTQTALFAEEYLFGPLGIEEYFWATDPNGVTLGFSDLYLKPADMARIGYLYLHGGIWEEQQIISQEWVTASSTPQIPATLQDGYGYQWWIDDAGYYMALGYRGQFIFVLPDYDMVVVFLSDPDVGDFDAPEYLLTNYIIRAVESD
jgi:CubicO group peptidase (beta-lactamase class C family)